MSELSPEEKRKIYEEEKARLEAQEKLKTEAQAKKNKNAGLGCLAIIGIVAIIWIISNISGGKSSSSTSSSSVQDVTLKAAVRFTGNQFVLTNEDTFAWTDVKIEINSGMLKSGFIYRADRIEAGKTYTVGALQFAKPDGTRLNPFSVKPQNVTITASTPRGSGFFYGGWK